MPSAARSWISLPEIAAGLGIDARRRFVEQQQARRVQRAARERQALLPAARQRSRELLCALRRGRAARASPRPPPCAGDTLVDPCDEIEVLLDRQVVVEAEALRHVPDFALDRLGLLPQVVAEAGPAALVGRQQPAKHADRRRLAAAVRSQEAENLAALDANREVVDDRAAAVALGEAADVDGRLGPGRRQHLRSHRAGAASVTSTGNPGCSAATGTSGRASTR